MQGHIENFIATVGRTYYIGLCGYNLLL